MYLPNSYKTSDGKTFPDGSLSGPFRHLGQRARDVFRRDGLDINPSSIAQLFYHY